MIARLPVLGVAPAPAVLPRAALSLQLEPQPTTFEAQGDPIQAAILLSVVLLPFGYWWYVTVPEARINLAKDKRLEGGETKAFLEELAQSEEGERPVEKWFFSKWLRQRRPAKARPETVTSVADASVEQAPPVAHAAEDREVQQAPAREVTLGELLKPASLKSNPTPKFWSGDNPIVVTMGALLTVGVFSAAARTNSALAIDGAILAAGLAFGLSRLTLD